MGHRAAATDARPTHLLTELPARHLLEPLGVPFPRQHLVESADDADGCAATLGAHVVMKIVSPDLVHKADVGGVRTDVPSDSAGGTFTEIVDSVRRNAPHARIDGVIVQQQVQGVPVLIGTKTDDVFGPVIVVGAGGVDVEEVGDTAISLAPVDAPGAAELLGRTRVAHTIEGHHGAVALGVVVARRAGRARLGDHQLRPPDQEHRAQPRPRVRGLGGCGRRTGRTDRRGMTLDLELTDDQELFLDTTERFLTRSLPTSTLRTMIDDGVGVDRDMWSSGAELGWTSMLVPERFGGGSISGDGVRDLGIVAEVLGRSLFPGPVLTTNVVAFALARGGSAELSDTHLPAVVTGTEIATWAAFDDDRSPEAAVRLTPGGTGFELSGTKVLVQDAHVADHLLVVASAPSGTTQVLLPIDSPGISVEVLDGLDLARRYCRVRFDQVAVPETSVVGDVGGAGRDVGLQLSLAVALQCAETVGATDRVYDMTLEYVKDRKAFGRPIGSYQALKHRLADMLLWLESAKAVTVAALEAVQREADRATPPRGAATATSLAKAYVGDRCPAIVRDCFQMHGGIACTWEHDLHLFMRRVDTNTAVYGDVDHHRDLLAPAVGF